MPRTRSQTDAIRQLRQIDAIRLVPNNTSCSGKYWALGQYEPSTVLSRVKIQAQEPEADIILTKFIGSTGVVDSPAYNPQSLAADIYRADAKIGDNVMSGLVVKIIEYLHLPRTEGKRNDFQEEAEFFDLAKDVQGLALPRFAGLFTSASLQCLIFEDAGRRVDL